ncbi:MAG TPA: plasmid replication initiator TrfA [Arsenophonus nasoniae]|uniref:plasmid replication initiator TrfA n=1 Tax=Arsenophonus nasoniae TaxID=638 RepID=UPI003878F85E
MDSIWNKVDRIAKKLAEKKEINQLNSSENMNKKQEVIEKEIYLPVTKINFIPVPNAILRSALFGVVKKGTRKYEKNVLKTALNNYTVKYTGEQLDQSDLDVWLECLQRCQINPLGYTVKFSAYSFLRSIGRSTGKAQYKWLKNSLIRLAANVVEISDGKYTYKGGLIFEQYEDEETGENCLILNPKIVSCFSDTDWTGITKEVRLKLMGKSLTQWLHAFYCSHAKPHPIKIVTLKTLCCSDVKNLFKFRQMLKKSLNELAFSTGWYCEIDSTDKVIIRKKQKIQNNCNKK